MKNNRGTDLEKAIGQFAEFAGAVTKSLPKNLDKDFIQYFLLGGNQQELREFLKEAFDVKYKEMHDKLKLYPYDLMPNLRQHSGTIDVYIEEELFPSFPAKIKAKDLLDYLICIKATEFYRARDFQDGHYETWTQMKCMSFYDLKAIFSAGFLIVRK